MKPIDQSHVAVLMGGLSSEREVSLVSGKECAAALERLGAKVSAVDAGRVERTVGVGCGKRTDSQAGARNGRPLAGVVGALRFTLQSYREWNLECRPKRSVGSVKCRAIG